MTHRAMQLTDWLDDLCVRFIVNLPREELESVERICFQVEEAQWFYEDFIRPLDPNLPSLNLRQFSMKIFRHCPLFSAFGADAHAQAFAEFLAYKTRVPVRGAILLNETMDQVILVKGWKKGANWSFPRGKINKDEKDIDCAIREVYEETGFDINAAGLNIGQDNAKFIEVTMREQHMKLFVFAGVPMNTYFEPRTRKEISAIQWYKLSELPTLRKVKQQQDLPTPTINNNKFYMVAPFVRPLKRIISQLRREHNIPVPHSTHDTAILEQDVSMAQAPAGGNENEMTRLLTQLRQSSQASRESNYPEVSDTPDATPDASQHLRDMLSRSAASREPHAPQQQHQQAAAQRENKANAMLSLLRSGSSGSVPTQPPQTPFEQIIPPQNLPPPSPKHHHSVRTPRISTRPTPPVFEVSPDQPDRYRARHPDEKLPPIHVSPQDQQAMLPTFLRDPPRHYAPPVEAPYRQTGDPQFTSATPTQDLGPSAIPHASKLPPPKLNAHSSNLLNLFKSTQSQNPAVPPLETRQAPAPTTRPELSAFSPVIHRPAMTSFGPAMMSSTPALALANPEIAISADSPKPSAQQETLLGLFRTAKPSPSLAPPHDPVELSAQGSPTHRRSGSDQQFRADKSKGATITIAKRPDRDRTPQSNSSRVSATVSGPLNYPQFDKILQRQNDAKPSPETPHAVPAKEKKSPAPEPAVQQQPVKILARPQPVQKHAASSPKQPERSSGSGGRRLHKSRPSSKELPFQPQQILKRPQSSSSTTGLEPSDGPARSTPTVEQQQPSKGLLQSVPAKAAQAQAPSISPKPANPLAPSSVPGHSQGQTPDQKATLLRLFNSPKLPPPTVKVPAAAAAAAAAPVPAMPTPTPVPSTSGTAAASSTGATAAASASTAHERRRGSMVSPLSEKPPTSGLSSPQGVNRSGAAAGMGVPEMDSTPLQADFDFAVGPAAGGDAKIPVPTTMDDNAGDDATSPLRTPLALYGNLPGPTGRAVGKEAAGPGHAPRQMPPAILHRAPSSSASVRTAIATHSVAAAATASTSTSVPPLPPPARSGVSSPVDRKFLLGFLDSVASQGK